MTLPRLASLALFVLVLTADLGVPLSARAQLSVSATAESAYRFRGVALTNSKPDVRLAVAYDHPSGAYAGAAGLVGGGANGDVHGLGYLGYVGYVHRTASGLNLDVGATAAHVVDTLQVYLKAQPNGVPARVVQLRYSASYAELYAGVIKDQLSAHLYVSPNYLDQGMSAAYLDLAGAVRPARRVRLFAHAGLLMPFDRPSPTPAAPAPGRQALQYDLKLGAALELAQSELQLSWTTVGPKAQYPIGYPQKRSALIASAAVFF